LSMCVCGSVNPPSTTIALLKELDLLLEDLDLLLQDGDLSWRDLLDGDLSSLQLSLPYSSTDDMASTNMKIVEKLLKLLKTA
jgi:hypothetical protein